MSASVGSQSRDIYSLPSGTDNASVSVERDFLARVERRIIAEGFPVCVVQRRDVHVETERNIYRIVAPRYEVSHWCSAGVQCHLARGPLPRRSRCSGAAAAQQGPAPTNLVGGLIEPAYAAVHEVRQQQKFRIRAAAWVLLGLSLLVAAFELWVLTPSFAATDLGGDPASPSSIILTVILIYGVWLLVGLIDVVSFIVMRGWRNRLIVIAGFVLLAVPLAITFWTLNN